MNIVRYRPWAGNSVQSELRQAFDRLLEGNLLDQDDADESSVVTSQWVPRVDVKEESDRFVLYADLPGIDPNDIEVSMDKGVLSIKGERRSETSSQPERFSRIERRYGSFHRRFALPDSADPDVLAEAETIFAAAVALKVDPNATAEEDPYADPKYQVPDDLVW